MEHKFYEKLYERNNHQRDEGVLGKAPEIHETMSAPRVYGIHYLHDILEVIYVTAGKEESQKQTQHD